MSYIEPSSGRYTRGTLRFLGVVRFRRGGDDVDASVLWLLKAGPSLSEAEAEACCLGPGDGPDMSLEADIVVIMARKCPNKVPLVETRDLKTGGAEIGGARQLVIAV